MSNYNELVARLKTLATVCASPALDDLVSEFNELGEPKLLVGVADKLATLKDPPKYGVEVSLDLDGKQLMYGAKLETIDELYEEIERIGFVAERETKRHFSLLETNDA